MKIYEIKCREVFANPGYANIAEAVVEETDGSETFVAVQEYNGLDMTVSKQSMYVFLCGDGADSAEEFSEEYTAWKDAKASAYWPVFEKLRKLMKMLGGC